MVAFRRHTLLPLDDCLYALRPSMPQLTRSSLHRCLQRHDISPLRDATSSATTTPTISSRRTTPICSWPPTTMPDGSRP